MTMETKKFIRTALIKTNILTLLKIIASTMKDVNAIIVKIEEIDEKL